MRDINRARMSAMAKSRRASKEELREAQNRIKEIDAELRQLELQPQTKQGEEREARYERVLRLRQMRDDFESRFPIRSPEQPNSMMLALVMTIGSFLTCAFCAGGFYFAFNALNYNPGPVAIGSTFWSDAKTHNYQDVYVNVLATNLRVEFQQGQFVNDATQADKDYGTVTDAFLTKQDGDLKTDATLTYRVTRMKSSGKVVTYTVKLGLSSKNNAWTVTDIGASIYPTQAGVPPVGGTPTPTSSPGP